VTVQSIGDVITLKNCDGCGASYSRSAWFELRFRGKTEFPDDNGDIAEVFHWRTCRKCGKTLGVDVKKYERFDPDYDEDNMFI
jgi:NMD protein affecting ribosome stability and mRNA decay